MIVFDGVVVAHRGQVVLGPIHAKFEPGALVGLIGPPSSGKSLLLKLIGGLVRPTRGTVEVLGCSMASAKAADLEATRRRIGMVFQNNALFDSRTIFENVAYPLRRSLESLSESEIGRRVRERLSDVGISVSEQLFPHQLSGGMQKRAGIARATVTEPEVRLYDEPTAGLDPVTSARILALVTRIHAHLGGVSIVISNEMDTLLKAVDRVILLDAGRIVFDGPRAEIDQGAAPPEVFRFTSGAL